MNDNNIGDEGAVFIAQALMKNRGVRHLELTSHGIGAEGAAALANMLTKICWKS